jgi:trimeric autotransporter adhesin
MERMVFFVAAATIGLWSAQAQAQLCEPRWNEIFGNYDFNSDVIALAFFDNGAGRSLYAGGAFSTVNGSPFSGMAMHDGTGWLPVGGGVSGQGPRVQSLLSFDDGIGRALYLGGRFSSAGDTPAMNIARWDGQTYSALGAGLPGRVNILATHDDGTGPALFAAYVGASVYTNRLARWTGTEWTDIGQFASSAQIAAMISFDDGSGPALCVGGLFNTVNGGNVTNVARWNGTWAPMGDELYYPGSFPVVQSLVIHDDGTGPALFAGGVFYGGRHPTKNFARWNGTGWDRLGVLGDNAPINNAVSFDDGTGARLYGVSAFTSSGSSRLGWWNGLEWVPLPGTEAGISSLVADPGSLPRLIAAGSFPPYSGSSRTRVAVLQDNTWSGLQSRRGLRGRALVAESFQGSIVVGGLISGAADVPVNNIARWDGNTWSGLGDGISGSPNSTPASVSVMEVVNDQHLGESLFVAGHFLAAGAVQARGLARWDGQTWHAVPGPVGLTIRALRAGNLLPGGDGLLVGGTFANMGGSVVNSIARWDGQSWLPLGAGLRMGAGPGAVWDLEVHDDGTGVALYAGGWFDRAGESAAWGVAKWNGAAWSALIGPTGAQVQSGFIYTLKSYDDGTGPALYIGGDFVAMGLSSQRLARWRLADWEAFNGPVTGIVEDLTVLDEGRSLCLVVLSASPMDPVSSWDGESWSTIVNGIASQSGSIRRLHIIERPGQAQSLLVLGEFDGLAQHGAGSIAEYRGCPRCPADCDNNGVLDVADFACFIAMFTEVHGWQRHNQLGHYTNCDGSTIAPVLNVDDFTCFINHYAQGCP